jgi:hypothetical protein
MERIPANFLDCTNETTLSEIFTDGVDNALIVT